MYISSTIIKITIKADIFSFKVVFLISKLIFDFPIFISFFIFLCYNGCGWRVTIPQTCFLFGKLYYNAENKQVDCNCYFFYFQHFFIFLCHYNLFNSFLDISILYFNIKSQDFSFRACLLERKAFTIQNVPIKSISLGKSFKIFFRFTIQNVPIKSYLPQTTYIVYHFSSFLSIPIFIYIFIKNFFLSFYKAIKKTNKNRYYKKSVGVPTF